MKALILAAGYATRLYPLTKEYPKPLLEVRGRPIIDYIVDKLKAAALVDEIYVVTNTKFIHFFRSWAGTVKFSGKITLIDDQTKSNRARLGSIGDMDFVIKRQGIKDDLLVVGGDNLFSGPLKGFLSFSCGHRDAACIGLYRLRNRKDAVRYGVAKLGRRKEVVSFIEKPGRPDSSLVAMCLYYIPRDLLNSVSQYMRDKKEEADTTGGYIAWLKMKVKVYGYVFKGSWFDIGDYKYLNAAKEKFA